MNIIPIDNPEPIFEFRDTEDSEKKPLFLMKEDEQDNPTPIFPSPGYITNPYSGSGNLVIASNQIQGSSSSAVNSIRDPDSDGNSMGVLYQSTGGSVILEQQEGRRNGICYFRYSIDLGSRMNSPVMKGKSPDFPLFRTAMNFLLMYSS